MKKKIIKRLLFLSPILLWGLLSIICLLVALVSYVLFDNVIWLFGIEGNRLMLLVITGFLPSCFFPLLFLDYD